MLQNALMARHNDNLACCVGESTSRSDMKCKAERRWPLALILGSIALGVFVSSCFWDLSLHSENALWGIGYGRIQVLCSDVDSEWSVEIDRVDWSNTSIGDIIALALPQLWGIGGDPGGGYLGGLQIPLWPWPLVAVVTSQSFRRRPIYLRACRHIAYIIHHRAFRFGRRLAGAIILVVAFLSVFSFAGVGFGGSAVVQQGELILKWWYENEHPPAAWLEWTGFDFKWQWPMFVNNPGDLIYASIPTWLLAPIGVVLLAYRRKPKPTEPSCKKCGYILIGNQSGVCAECGTRFADPKNQT